MADAQQFLVSRPNGGALLLPSHIEDALRGGNDLGPLNLTVTEVVDDSTVATILPWRVRHDGTTYAAVDTPERAVDVLKSVAGDLDGWSIEFHTAVI